MSVEISPIEEDYPYVCKFRDINENFLNLLPNSEIYIPTVAQLNDPLEGVLTEGYLISHDHLPILEQEPTESQINAHFAALSAHKKKCHRLLAKSRCLFSLNLQAKLARIQLFADVGLICKQP